MCVLFMQKNVRVLLIYFSFLSTLQLYSTFPYFFSDFTWLNTLTIWSKCIMPGILRRSPSICVQYVRRWIFSPQFKKNIGISLACFAHSKSDYFHTAVTRNTLDHVSPWRLVLIYLISNPVRCVFDIITKPGNFLSSHHFSNDTTLLRVCKFNILRGIKCRIHNLYNLCLIENTGAFWYTATTFAPAPEGTHLFSARLAGDRLTAAGSDVLFVTRGVASRRGVHSLIEPSARVKRVPCRIPCRRRVNIRIPSPVNQNSRIPSRASERICYVHKLLFGNRKQNIISRLALQESRATLKQWTFFKQKIYFASRKWCLRNNVVTSYLSFESNNYDVLS